MPLRSPLALLVAALLVAALLSTAAPADDPAWPQYDTNPFVVKLPLPAPEDSAGGVIAADVDGDTRPDYLVTVPGHIAAFSNAGRLLWHRETPVQVGGSSEREGLPGHNGPGLQVGDVDSDGAAEVLWLTRDGFLVVADGRTGRDEARLRVPFPEKSERWEHLVLANFRGRGDLDLLLQTTNRRGYRMGQHLAAYPIPRLLAKARKSEKVRVADALWTTGRFLACAHNGARVADLDGDGRDEVLGGTIFSPGGKVLHHIPLRGHVDSIYAYDVRPDLPGLEVVALEEGGGNRVFVFNAKKDIWIEHCRNQEPQNGGVAELDPARPGLEIWCRSRYNEHQRPFVFDARGKLIRQYAMDDVAPKDWTVRGVELIWRIAWTGGEKDLLAATERHTSGDVAVFDGISGKFVARFDDKADRLYVADVSGDWREELVVINGSELHVWHNDAANPRPDRPRLWTLPHYRRAKMTYNYYSP